MNDKLAALLNAPQLYPHQLEKVHPHIVEKICAHWQAGSLDAYLDSLLFDRRGNRSGFSAELMAEMVAIQNHYRGLQPPKPRSIDTWADSVEP